MKKAFLGRILGGVVAIATITSLSPLGVSAAGKNNTINNCFKTNCVTTNGCGTTNSWGCNTTNDCSKTNGNWFYLDSNGQLQSGNNAGNNKQDCNTQCGSNKDTTNCSNSSNCINNESNTDNTITDNLESNNTSDNDVTVADTTKNDNANNNTTVTENNNTNSSTTATKNTDTNNSTNTDTNKNATAVENTNAVKNTDSNKTATVGESVNVSGLSKLPEKYAISIQNSAENKILELMNEKRTQAGLKPLTIDNTLLQVARYKSDHMIQYNYFDHTNPDGTKWTNWLQSIGYKYNTTGENIAYNTYDPVKLFEQWWNSPGHRANMMNPSYNKVGIGVIFDKDNNKYMGTQTFSN